MTKATTITDTATAVDACQQLALTGLAPVLSDVFDDATRRRLSHPTFLAEALRIELDIRHERRRARRVHEAKLPRIKTLDDFDLDANANITPATIALLRDGTFVTNNEPVVLLGNSGTGKSHLLIGTCLAAAENGLRARYVTCAQLANELAEAADDHKLSRVVARYGRYDLLAIDELGYVHLDAHSAELLFQILTERENARRSPLRPTHRSASGPRPSPTNASPPPSSTASPTEPTSSRPAPPATGSPAAKFTRQMGPDQAGIPGPDQAVELSRGTVLRPAAPVSFETVIGCGSVSWWVRLDGRRARRLQSAAERSMPGLRWEAAERPDLNISRAVELRVDSAQRLLAVERAEAAIGRLLGVSVELGPGEVVLVQWQIGSWLARSPIPPAASGAPNRSLWNLPDWSLPSRNSEQVQAARKKAADPVFAAVGRVAVAGAAGRRAGQLIAAVIDGYQILRAPGVGVSQRSLPSWWVRHRLDVDAVPQLAPAIRLTATELATVIGWPVGNPALGGVRYAAATRLAMDTASLVSSPKPSDRILGSSAYPAQSSKQVVLTAKDGLRHLHVVGPTGVGKSTLLANLILADITAGRGVVAIDPKGDLVTEVLARVPEHRRDRVVVLDPADPSPIGFNPLTGTLGLDGVLHVMQSLWASSWGPRLGDILHAGLLTLARTPGHCLPELPLLLTDPAMRRRLVPAAVAADPLGLGTFWAWYEGLSDDARAQALAPVMNKLRAFLLRPELRAVLGQSQPRFDLNRVFTDRMTLLVRLPKGQVGGEGAQLLGSLLVSHLWRLSLSRAALPAEKRRPVFFYLDEFQDFLRLPVDLGDALVQARGLGVGLVLAHQHLDQLDRAVRSAVLANAGSRVAFRLDHDDAAVLAKRSGGRLRPEDLSGLTAYEAYASVLVNGEATPYGSLITHDVAEPLRPAERLLAESRSRFGVPAVETEAALRDLLEPIEPPASSGTLGGRRSTGASS